MLTMPEQDSSMHTIQSSAASGELGAGGAHVAHAKHHRRADVEHVAVALKVASAAAGYDVPAPRAPS